MRWATYASAAVLLLGVPLLRNLACANNKPTQQARAPHDQIVVSDASALGSSTTSSSQNAYAPILETDDFELRDWFAFGSGCRARPTQPGDVTVRVSKVAGVPGRYRVGIALPSYGITPTDHLLQTTASFARECGIRLAVYPTAGKKLSNVAANPVYRVNKPAGPRTRLRARLFAGDTTLFQVEKWHPEGQELHDQEQPAYGQMSTSAAQAAFDQLLCEQPRIVGLDLSAALVRQDLTRYEVTLVPVQRSVEILLQFTACGPPTYSSSHQSGIQGTASVQGRLEEQETQ